MRLRRAALGAALVGTAGLLLHAVRPGVVENGLRSPRVWLVVVVVLLAGRATAAVLQRVTGRPRLARTAGVLVPLVATVVLLAPSFQQRELVEPFPVAAPRPVAAAAPAATLPAPEPVPADSPQPPLPQPSPPPSVPPPSVPPAPAPPRPTAAPAPQLLASGPLDGIGHSASGTSSLYATAGGTVLRFEDVDIEGTVEPVVYLVPFGARTPDDGLRLGALKAERGSFGYTVPSGVDAERPWTVLVWCAPYDTPIAAADLPAG